MGSLHPAPSVTALAARSEPQGRLGQHGAGHHQDRARRHLPSRQRQARPALPCQLRLAVQPPLPARQPDRAPRLCLRPDRTASLPGHHRRMREGDNQEEKWRPRWPEKGRAARRSGSSTIRRAAEIRLSSPLATCSSGRADRRLTTCPTCTAKGSIGTPAVGISSTPGGAENNAVVGAMRLPSIFCTWARFLEPPAEGGVSRPPVT